jgi:hypothetical protein
MNYFLVFEESFSFLRQLILKVKRNQITEEEKEIFTKVFNFWAKDDLSILVLALISGNYKLFYKLIITISNRELNEVDLVAFTKIVTLLELSYFAYIRLGNYFVFCVYL